MNDDLSVGGLINFAERPPKPIAQRPGTRFELRRRHDHIHGNFSAQCRVILAPGHRLSSDVRTGARNGLMARKRPSPVPCPLVIGAVGFVGVHLTPGAPYMPLLRRGLP